MRNKITALLSILVLFAAAGTTSAALVTFTDSADITSTGQSFTFTETPSLLADGTGLFTIFARGDYTSISNENLDWEIDGIVSGSDWGPVDHDFILDLDPTNPDTHAVWSKSISIAQTDLNAILGDNFFTLNITNDSGVTVFPGRGDFVSYTLQYNPVPLPPTLLLFGSGIFGLVGATRRIRT